MTRRTHDFQTIRSEGGLLPADLLRRVLDRSGKLAGTRPEDYGLPPGERLNEAITQSWNRLRKHWAEFQAARSNLPENEAGTGLTNERWNLPLLREFDFGLLPTSAGPEIDGRTYAISRFFGPVPVHLIGCGLSLDRRAAGQRGAAVANPHGLVQEFLNRSDAHLWALLSNGLRLRVLRDNQALSRQSFLEFDLEAMFSGEVYSDFVLLWLVVHATRFAPGEGDRPETCWLEQWTQEAEAQGVAALKELGRQVEQALVILGEGFTSHPKNTALRDAIRSGTLQPTELHAQLLRLVYRLIFLFVAEDRTLEGQSLLHPPDDTDGARTARALYAAHYSTARLREMAGRIKGSRHGDLWKQFQLLVAPLAGDAACQAIRQRLALPALGSFLWDPAATPDLNGGELTNFDLLEALRHLAFTRQGKFLRPVDYRNLGAEELGGIYESLLALTPQVSGDGARFSFAEFAGNERKTSGSYYTPDSLVQCLLDSALDPVVEAAIKGKAPVEAEAAILALKVCDPAVGSGHFLVGAAHRLARHLARVRALAEGEGEPSPVFHQHALRDVIGRCLYGVDLNPMAAELCRVSLWLEALDPGKPLSFLDHHIRVGNSLLGTTPELIAGGLPDDAYKPIEGDDKKICAVLRKRNKQERDGGQMDLGLPMVAEARAEYETLASRSRGVDQAPDDSLEAIMGKADQFRRLVVSPEYRHRQTIADAWCAAFVWPKTPEAPEPITTETIRRLEGNPEALDPGQGEELERLAGKYQFFHWQIAFPEVFVNGGFDCILGNPPWERTALEELEFFSARSEEVLLAPTTAARKRVIAALKKSDPNLFLQYAQAKRMSEGESQFFKASGLYALGARGRSNTYAIFANLGIHLIQAIGRVGMIVQTGIAVDAPMERFWRFLVQENRLVSLIDFENKVPLFPEVHREQKFSLLTFRGSDQSGDLLIQIGFWLSSPEELKDPDKVYGVDVSIFDTLSPNTSQPILSRRRADLELVAAIYRRNFPSWNNKTGTGPARAWVAMTSAGYSAHYLSRDELRGLSVSTRQRLKVDDAEYWPLLEAKQIYQFDFNYASYEHANEDQTRAGNPIQSIHPSGALVETPMPRFWAPYSVITEFLRSKQETQGWVSAYRDVTNVNNERTMIAAILPEVGLLQPLNGISCGDALQTAIVLASLNSMACDYVGRLRFTGRHLNVTTFSQLPLASVPQLVNGLFGERDFLARVLELVFVGWDLHAFSKDCGWDGPPFRWNEDRRFRIRSELDAAFFNLYLPADENGNWRPARKADGCPHDETPEQFAELQRYFPTPRDAVAYIMDTFHIIRRKEEEKFGEYRTKRVILEIYDAMREAIRTGQHYQTLLDPPPGPPVDADGDFVSYADIADDPPSHVHLPRHTAPGSNIALQIPDLAMRFPDAPFRLRLNTEEGARELRVMPVRTSDVTAADTVVLASPNLQHQGVPVQAAVGRLRVESRTDAEDGSTYLLVSVRGDDGMAQARFSEDEWQGLATVGVVMDDTPAEAGHG